MEQRAEAGGAGGGGGYIFSATHGRPSYKRNQGWEEGDLLSSQSIKESGSNLLNCTP